MTRFDVTATSQGRTRTERIDTETNSLFSPRDSIADVRRKYEKFWNTRGAPRVRVLQVKEVDDPFGFGKLDSMSFDGVGRMF